MSKLVILMDNDGNVANVFCDSEIDIEVLIAEPDISGSTNCIVEGKEYFTHSKEMSEYRPTDVAAFFSGGDYKAPQKHHYFVASAAVWAVDEDSEEALKKVVEATDKQLPDQDYPLWKWKVPLPLDSDYRISFYKPQVEGATLQSEHQRNALKQRWADEDLIKAAWDKENSDD